MYLLEIPQKYTLTIMDKVSLAQVAADIKTGKNIESVPDLPHEAKIRVAPSHTINEIYFAVCNQLQFVYFRNYMKRVVHRFTYSDTLQNCFERLADECIDLRDQEGIVGTGWPCRW